MPVIKDSLCGELVIRLAFAQEIHDFGNIVLGMIDSHSNPWLASSDNGLGPKQYAELVSFNVGFEECYLFLSDCIIESSHFNGCATVCCCES